MRANALLVVAAVSLNLLAADWPQWRGPNRDGIAGGAAPETWPDKLNKKWQVTIGEGHSSPILGDGKLFVFAREGKQEVVRALDPATGKELWKQSYEAPFKISSAADSHGPGPKSTPVFAAGKLCTFGLGGVLACWDAASGRLLWKQDFYGMFKHPSPDFGAAMSPLVGRGMLFVHAGGDGDGALMAFDLATGAVKWSWKGDGPAYASPVILEAGGVRQLVTQSQRNIIALSESDGQLLWQMPFKTDYEQNSVTPIVYGPYVIVSGLKNGAMALRPVKDANGWHAEKTWENPAAAMYMSTATLSGDMVFGFGHKNKGQFFCLNAKTGVMAWMGEPRQGDNASIVRQGNTIYLLKDDGELIVARTSATAMEILKKYTVAGSPTWAHPVVSGDGIIVKDKMSVIMWTWK